MKLVIASDIHGNAFYTKKLVDFINNNNPDNIIILGDILGSYRISDEVDSYMVANYLNGLGGKIISVRGNCDNDEDNMLLNFDNTHNYRELIIDDIKYSLTHGHIRLPFINSDTKLICGHSHEPKLSLNYINPGSVGLPRGGSNHSCILYENKCFKLIDLEDNKIIEELNIM